MTTRFPALSWTFATSAVIFGALGCGTEPGQAPERLGSQRGALVDVLPNRSLAVTEADIVSLFSLEELLAQLIAQAGVVGQTPLQLFQAWAATNDVCSEEIGGVVVPNSFNGFPFSCRPGESPAEQSPFAGSGRYAAIGLFNRFDLAPADGADCGEYRLVFGRNDVDPVTRKNLIFEARLPNPQPSLGLEGCRSVAEFWGNLSNVASNAERAALLHDFFFDGLDGFAPVIHIDHFARLPSSGRVRTNSFLSGTPWSLREYGVREVCDPDCELRFVEFPTGDNPFFELSGDPAGHPQAASFQDWFIASLTPGSGLLAGDVNRLVMNAPDEFLMGESQLPENIGAPTPPPRNIADELSPAFAARIQTRLTELGSSLTPAQLINRADSTTCTGCHRSANGDDVGFGAPFPSSLGFRQMENRLEPGPDGDRFRMSSALLDVFLPFREANLEQFLSIPGLVGTLSITSQWNEGYCTYIELTNEAAEPLDWQATIEIGASAVTSSWQATFTHVGTELTATRPSWQGLLEPDTTINFGYCATKFAGWTPPTMVVEAL